MPAKSKTNNISTLVFALITASFLTLTASKMKDKFDNLAPLIDMYKNEMAAVGTRRKEWSERVKPMLISIFERLIERFQLPCHVGSHHQLKNQDTIFLAFDDLPSGVENTETQEVFIKQGGGLAYSQNVNGKISVLIVYPYIHGIKGEAGASKEISIYKPHTITEDLVLRHLDKFFRQSVQWECFLREPIGYKMKM